jgi:hypothetical protein
LKKTNQPVKNLRNICMLFFALHVATDRINHVSKLSILKAAYVFLKKIKTCYSGIYKSCGLTRIFSAKNYCFNF